MWLKERARIHQQGKDAHLQPQKKPTLLGAMDESEITENSSFGGFTMPQQQQQCLLLVCYPRLTNSWSAFSGLSCLWAFVWHSTTDRSAGWGPNATRSSGSGFTLGFTLPGFRIQSAETAALRPQALSGTTRGTGLSRGLLMSYTS